MREIKYIYFRLIMFFTNPLPDFTFILKFRGFLLRPAFKKCGRNLQVASGVIVNWSDNIIIGKDVFIGNNCWIQGVGSIVIKDEVMLGPFTVLATNNHTRRRSSWRYGPPKRGKIVLEEGSWTGAGVILTAGVCIGKGSAVAAGGIITKDVPKDCMAGIKPADIIKKFDVNS